VADAFWLQACAVKGGFDDGGFIGVGQSRLRSAFSPALPALGCIIEERIDGGVGLALHAAIGGPKVSQGREGHSVACAGKPLIGESVLSFHAIHERDPIDLRALGGEADY